jgi:hypothetical protein
MTEPSKIPSGGLTGQRGEKPDLRELTISIGRSDLYVNLGKHVEMADGHLLFEAILTDENGSRVIYVDKEDIAECMKDSFVLGGMKPE